MNTQRLLILSGIGAILALALSSCGMLNPQPYGAGVSVGGSTNAIPATAIAATGAKLFELLLGVEIPSVVSTPLTMILIGAWWYIRARRKKVQPT